QQFTDPGAALAVARELEDRAGQRDGGLVDRHAGQALAPAHVFGELVAVSFVEQRLMVEQFLLGRAATLAKVDDAPGLRRKVRSAKDTERGIGFGGHRFARKHGAQGQAAESEARGGEKMPPGEGQRMKSSCHCHGSCSWSTYRVMIAASRLRIAL